MNGPKPLAARARQPMQDATRRADLAKIHLAVKELGWDDDHYRDVLQQVCGVRSAGQLDVFGRRKFVAHLRKCGWDGEAANKKRTIRDTLSDTQKLMWSLWQQLVAAGKVNDGSMAGLMAFGKRITKVERLEWLNRKQEDLLIESLKQWLARKG